MKLRLIEDDYAVFRKFEGRCALSTYLTVVVQRLLSDYRNHLWGKWRPSARSERLGPLAIRIETLISRDRHSPDEAFALLESGADRLSRAEFDAIVSGIPERASRPRAVALEDVADTLSTSSESIETEAERSDRGTLANTVMAALREGLARLGVEDRAILRMHFGGGMKIAEVARSLHLDQKQLYRRIERICAALRHDLVAAGVDSGKADDIIGRPDVSLDFGLTSSGIRISGPSAVWGRGDAEDQFSR